MNPNLKYLFYPSLLDKFSAYLNPGKLLDYGKTEDEIERELLDAINRVPHESEAAEKGTAFNNLVDAAINAKNYEDIPMVDGLVHHTSKQGNKYAFQFPVPLVMDFAEYFKGAASQVFCEGTIETRYGLVGLYGYADEIKGATVYDIKTTGNYEFPKYLHSWQRHVYPYCLRQQGVGVEIFEFTVTDFKNTYKEVYTYEPEKTFIALRSICTQFIEYIEARRNVITDKKIFNQHE
ncbi:MAG: hypothetical protein LBS36_08875 [Oscillospiraceae bacterium]|jgi:hypothetical protein|nr:hypothetical protein [Oscillospiraceae bacterium]